MNEFEQGCTHPQIDMDFYDWVSKLSDFDKNFINDPNTTPNAIAMFAFQRSRTSLRERVNKSKSEE
jgi:hypothetical protein